MAEACRAGRRILRVVTTIADPDQRSLALDTPLPRPPEDLRPMQPRMARRLVVGESRLVDPTWGGLRVLAAVRGDEVRLLVDGLDVAARFPDIVASLAALDLPDAVLDGELVVPGTRGRTLAAAVRRGGGHVTPATLVISDLPWHGGRALFAESLLRRRDRLAELAIAGPSLVAVEPATGADAVLQIVALHGLHGIVAKRADSPYLPGVRSRLWTLVRTADVTDGAAHVPVASDAPDDPAANDPRIRPDIALLRTLPLGEDA